MTRRRQRIKKQKMHSKIRGSEARGETHTEEVVLTPCRGELKAVGTAIIRITERQFATEVRSSEDVEDVSVTETSRSTYSC